MNSERYTYTYILSLRRTLQSYRNSELSAFRWRYCGGPSVRTYKMMEVGPTVPPQMITGCSAAMTTNPPPFRTKRPGNNVPVLEMQTNSPASDHKLMAVLHGHRRPHLRCFSLTRPPTAQTPSRAVHLNNALPGTQTSFVY